MSFSPDKENQHSSWFRHRKTLNNALFTMRFNSENQREKRALATKTQGFDFDFDLVSDKSSLLSDEILLKILAKLPKSQRNTNSLVSKRWLNLQGRLVRSLKLLDWDFLLSGRLFLRFPNLISVDLVSACLVKSQNPPVLISNKNFVPFHEIEPVLTPNEIDQGLKILSSSYPNLRKLRAVNATELGLLNLAEECPALQELCLHMCNDQVLRGIAAFQQSLQILRIYGSLVSDVGMTILAQGCKILTKLELSGSRGSYEGAKSIGQCCPMLEELTLSYHQMEQGWLSALSFCAKLTTLRFVSCKRIDDGGCDDDEDLVQFPAIETLHLEKCQLRDRRSLRALFIMCENAREVIVNNCWGLTDDIFSTATAFRRVVSLSLEGCSLLSARGVEIVINYWKDKGFLKLKNFTVKSCNNIKELPSVFLGLKNLKWEADTKSRISSNLEGTGVGKRGSKFFNHSCDWKSL